MSRDAESRRIARTEFGRPVALEAGAGTGKTTTLVARLVAWLVGPGWIDARTTLRGSVAITFTEAAAAEMHERLTQALSELARRHGVALCCPAVERGGDDVYNACVVFDRSGRELVRYRKIHPWLPELHVAPGDPPFGSFELDGVRFALAICYDVHFLGDEAADELEAADVLLLPTAWVDDRRDGRAMLADLARDFDVWIVNANWGVGTPRVRGQGGSRVVDPRGRIVARAGDGVEVIYCGL